MARTMTGFWWSPTAEGTPALVASAAFFALGGLAGCMLALQMADSGADAVVGYLEHFLVSAQAGGLYIPALPEFLWRSLRWLLALFVLSFSVLGILGIPAICSARGFFLSFSIAAFAQAYGREGLALAFILLGIPGLLSIPAFLIMATQSLSTAYALAGRFGRRDGYVQSEHFFCCGVCTAVVCISLLAERYLIPALVAGMAGTLLR